MQRTPRSTLLRLTLVWYCISCMWNVALAQSWFEAKELIPQSFYSSIPAAISDIDGDRKDDLIILDQRRHLYVAYQRLWNQPYEIQFLTELDSTTYWSVVAVDVDRNGLRDIVLASEFGDLETFFQQPNGWEHVRTPANDVFSQAMNAVDLNEDGWIDLFVCNDVGYNAVFMNDGGDWKRDTTRFRDLDSIDAAGNYGSVWSDFDRDGDMDLYLAKCYAGAMPGDPRRINLLYENNGGQFQNTAVELGLDTDDQSWTGDFVDLNNDGSYECIVTNHDAPCSIYGLEQDTFQDISIQSGFNFESTVLQNTNEDFDRDGWLDIFISGQSEILYQNLGSGEFSFTPNYFERYYRINSGLTGDLNYDGKIDVYATYGELITGFSSLADKVWLNQLEDNRYLDVYLVGASSNPDAVGTRLDLYGPWGIQTREVKAGQSYGIQNSLTQRFGTGDTEIVDSLLVYWPSGKTDKLYNLTTNNYVFVHESNFTHSPAKSSPYQSFLCMGDTLLITAPENVAVQWMDNDTSHSRTFTTAGFYQYSVWIDSQWVRMPGQELIYNHSTNKRIQPGETCFCDGDELVLTSDDGSVVMWSTGELDNMITVDSSGEYFFSYYNTCGDTLLSDTILIEEKIVPRPNGASKADTVPPSDSLCLTVSGDNIRWFDTNNNLLGTGDTLKAYGITSDTSFHVSNNKSYALKRDTIGANTSNLKVTLNQVNRALHFEVNQNTIIHSVDVFAEVAGERQLEILDPRRRVVFSNTYALDSGFNSLPIETVLISQSGLFRMTTNSAVNRANLGTPTPKLLAKSGLLNFPFAFGENVIIYHSSFSTTDYHYFFNWDVEQIPLVCESEKAEYRIVIDSTTGINSQEIDFYFYPNPGNERIILDEVMDQVNIYDQSGSLVHSQFDCQELFISGLKPAAYIVEFKKGNSLVRKLWVKN